jgi:hypothetical protein
MEMEIANRASPKEVETQVENIVDYYYPALVKPVKACLGVCGSMGLANRTRPLSLMLETPSGYGKTTVLEMFLPRGPQDPLGRYIYRSDKFTPKAFVTHAANRTAEELAKQDLLPKLHKKVFVTKELATIFRGREADLIENFSVLISVLDGMGFTSDTGMRGQRGYHERIMFNWLGATTPLPPAVHRLMSQLGTRLLFYEVDATFPTEEELCEYAQQDEAGEAGPICHLAVSDFLLGFFARHPIESVQRDSIHLSQEHANQIARWARFIAQGRAEVKYEKDDNDWRPIAAAKPEAPYKIVDYLKDLARGHALIEERDQISEPDLDLIAHIAISSLPGHLRPIVRLLGVNEWLDISACMGACKVGRKTARRYMKELELLKIAAVGKGSPKTNEPDTVSLTSEFSWVKQQT